MSSLQVVPSGSAHKSTSPTSDLRFPAIIDIPHENPFMCLHPDKFYGFDSDVAMYRPIRHWAFIAEIVADQTFLRPDYMVQDRNGDKMRVMFYLDKYICFDPRTFVVGHTIAVFYANMHTFMDCTSGLRVEEISTVKVIPCSLATLLSADPAAVDATIVCTFCSKAEPSLMRCETCKTKYCSKSCQSADWKAHKPMCVALKQMRAWNTRDWDVFHSYWPAF